MRMCVCIKCDYAYESKGEKEDANTPEASFFFCFMCAKVVVLASVLYVVGQIRF